MIFLKVYGWRKSPKTKKTQDFVWCLHFKTKNKQKTRKTKKQSFEAKPSSLFKVCFFVLRSCGYCHSLHITSFQIYQDNKQGLYMFILSICVCVLYVYIYIYMCVLKDMIQEALRWISGGYIIYTLAANDFGLVEHTPQSKRHRS